MQEKLRRKREKTSVMVQDYMFTFLLWRGGGGGGGGGVNLRVPSEHWRRSRNTSMDMLPHKILNSNVF